MQAYQIVPGRGIAGLERVRLDSREPGPGEVRVRVHAVSLNYRDLMIAQGRYLKTSGRPVVPASDGAGKVVAVGPGAERFRVGDRVLTSFFPRWIDGHPTLANSGVTLGASSDGVLGEEIVLHEDAFVPMPSHLDFVEASTLPCAAVTAWNAMFVAADLKPGQTVLLQGTGGVSIWALQLARAAGLRAVVTSSSDAKLARARELGAHATINYRTTVEWQEEALRLTDGVGVDLVLDVGGDDTLTRSLAAVRHAGTVAVVGGLSGMGGASLSPLALIGGGKRLVGIYVGSRKSAEDLYRFVETARTRPVIDRVFAFGQVREAYQHLAEGRHFGKVVIDVDA
ncbi:MAG TPA: NAD(P)-dependent alcohol dehydrogenase [Burkholderiaceae bacterium]|nr:NAD(P)-dependent alcohol dehydrogenase [Burkholderiaceae bacterium]